MFEILIYILKGIFQLLMWTWWIIVPIIALFAYQNFRKSKWVESLENVVLSVKIPKDSEKGPTAAEMMFASLHGILKPQKDLKREGSIQEHISFEMVADANSIVFYVWTPKHLQNFVEGQIYAQYPTAEIAKVEDYAKNIDIDQDGTEDCVAGCELKLIKPDYFPIKTFVSFEVDPLAGITGALSKIEAQSEKVWIQILTRPVSDAWRNKGLSYAEGLKNGAASPLSKAGLAKLPTSLLQGFFNAIFPTEDSKGGGGDVRLAHNVETSLACLEEKANKLGFQVKIRLLYIAKTEELAKQHLRMTSGAFKQFNTTLTNGFVPTKIRTGKSVLDEYRARLFHERGFVLNIEEVAILYHLPHASVETPNIVWTSSKKGEPPATLPYEGMVSEKELTVFAETTFRGQPKKFGIKRDDRRRHMYVIGKSGTGKSKLLELLAVSDIQRGEGVGVVDPHGELIHDILKKVPENRIKDIIYFNPADKEFPVGFNPLETTPEFREETTSGFVVALERLFGYSWGPRLEYVLRYAVLALTYTEDATMLSIIRMLTDKDYRKKVLERVEDPVVKTFWLKEWQTYNDRFQAEAVAPILNKVGQFTASPLIRNIVGQAKGTFDFAEAINTQKIILVDLSTGKIGEDNAELIGSFIITKLQIAAMARSKLNPEDRKDFYLYVDEFQNFATGAFATILSEARKYKLNLTLANQYIAQMEETVRDAVFGNVGSLISFRVGATDAAYLEKEFSPVFEKNDLINLDNRHIYLNMLIDGVTTIPFSARSADVLPADPTKDNTGKIILSSREKYSIQKKEIEDKISKWMNIDNIDVADRVDRQATSKFEMSNEQLERGETPKRLDAKKRAARQVTAQTTDFGTKNNTTVHETEKTPIKKQVDPEELKKIIQKLTNEKEAKGHKSSPMVEKISEPSRKEPKPVQKLQDRPAPKREDKEGLKPEERPIEDKAGTQDERIPNHPETDKLRFVEKPLKEEAVTQRSEQPAKTEVKKSVDPEELKRIIQKLTTPAVPEERKSPAEARIIKKNKLPIDSRPTLTSAQKGSDVKPDLKPVNPPSQTERPAPPTQPVAPEVQPINQKPQPTEVPRATTQPVQPKPVDPREPKRLNLTPIRITKVQGGVEIERIKPGEQIEIQPMQGRNIKPPEPLQANRLNILEDDNVRRITRDEFLELKEIRPNEKIVIVPHTEGETQTAKS